MWAKYFKWSLKGKKKKAILYPTSTDKAKYDFQQNGSACERVGFIECEDYVEPELVLISSFYFLIIRKSDQERRN